MIVDTVNLERLKGHLQQGIDNYSKHPETSKAFLKPSDMVQFYVLFKHLIEHVLEASRVVVACENSVRTMQATISNDRWAMQQMLEKATRPRRSAADEKKRKDPAYRLDHAELSTRSVNALFNEFGKDGTAFEVAEKTSVELLRIPNFGKVSLKEVASWLSGLGMGLSR